MKTLWNAITGVNIKRVRRTLGEPFVYVGNKIAGRDREMEALINLTIKKDDDMEFQYEVALTLRRYDIHIGTYDTYEEAGKVADNIEKSLKELA